MPITKCQKSQKVEFQNVETYQREKNSTTVYEKFPWIEGNSRKQCNRRRRNS